MKLILLSLVAVGIVTAGAYNMGRPKAVDTYKAQRAAEPVAGSKQDEQLRYRYSLHFSSAGDVVRLDRVSGKISILSSRGMLEVRESDLVVPPEQFDEVILPVADSQPGE